MTLTAKGLSSAVSYQDPMAAYRWLETAFGFEPLFVILDGDGNLAHSEMTYGNSVVMIGREWSDDHKSPRAIGGKNTQRPSATCWCLGRISHFRSLQSANPGCVIRRNGSQTARDGWRANGLTVCLA